MNTAPEQLARYCPVPWLLAIVAFTVQNMATSVGMTLPASELFQEAGQLLQQNEVIITEIETNQREEAIGDEKLEKNSQLIRQLNANLSRVIDLYKVI